MLINHADRQIAPFGFLSYVALPPRFSRLFCPIVAGVAPAPWSLTTYRRGIRAD
jgi:hypothetical protein